MAAGCLGWRHRPGPTCRQGCRWRSGSRSTDRRQGYEQGGQVGEGEQGQEADFPDGRQGNSRGGHNDLDMPNGVGIYSQLGRILLSGAPWRAKSPAMICAWKFQACDRRSVAFAAGTMAAMEGLESGMAFQASLVRTLLGRGLGEERCRCVIPAPIADCRSLYDTREGGPRASLERRLVVDVGATSATKLGWPMGAHGLPVGGCAHQGEEREPMVDIC